MAVATTTYRGDSVRISNTGGVVQIWAESWRAKRWAIKQLKREAADLGITFERKNGAYYATDPQKMRFQEYKLFERLKGCWESRTSRDLKKAFGFRGRNILDKGF